MDRTYDLIVRNASIVDGSGGAPFSADIAIAAGKIAAIGRIDGEAHETIDAEGYVVTPGFVDIHTHYDGQVTWDNSLYASSAHGVTTVVMGNCGVGFAPCKTEDRDRLINLMSGVEDIPEAVMAEGLPWNWETFPQYLDALEQRSLDIDFATQIPHSALRVYVMGQRAVDREPANATDLDRIEALTTEALRSGALGFSTSRYLTHRTRDGNLVPSKGADEAELLAIARGMHAAGTGVIEAIVDFDNFENEFQLLRSMVRESRRPLSFSLSQVLDSPDVWRRALELTEEANRDGLDIKAQVSPRPHGLLLGLDLSFNPFSLHASYREIEHLSLSEKVALMRKPDVRARILADTPADPAVPMVKFLRAFDWIYPLGDPPVFVPREGSSIAAVAARQGRSSDEAAYDALLEDDGQAILSLPLANYADRSLEPVLTMLNHRYTIVGLGDAGAHYGVISDSGYPTFMLSYWTRDHDGRRFELADVVKALTSEPAGAIGLNDRGRLAVGYKADLNIIDYDTLQLHAPHVVRDLPAGGRRLMQRASGFKATIVGGQIIMRDGVATGARPGRLVRGQRAAPAAP